MSTSERWRLSLERRPSLADRVSAWLTERIIDGTLAPGQQVSENELAAELGLSRSPVREALRDLARDHIVEVLPQRGTFISQLSASDINEIHSARASIEGEWIAMTIEHLTEGDLARLEELKSRTQHLTHDPRLYYDAFNGEVWDLLAERCPNPVMTDFAQSVRRRSLPYHGIVIQVPGMQDLLERFLQELLIAARNADESAARQATRRLFFDAGKACAAFLQLRG
jgi:DNA-binding GntR family transcriptional regulator